MTQAQHIASNPDHSVWVAASAGTGKTKVLTDRVLRLLLNGVPPEKILCLTFTTAAAAEMASRIQKKLGEWVTLPEPELQKQLENLTGATPLPALIARVRTLFAETLESPEGLNIQTIHAFCQSLISRFPLEAGINPNSQIIDEATAKELLEEAKLRLLRGLYKKTDQRADTAISAMSWRLAESSFAELMQEIIGKSSNFILLFQQHSLPELEIKIYQTLKATPGVTPENVLERACHNDYLNYEGLKLLSYAWLNGTPTEAKKGENLANWLTSAIHSRIQNYPSYLSLFLTKEGEPAKKILTKATLTHYPETEQILQHEQERLLRAEEQRKSQLCAELSLHVLHIAESLLAIYHDLKTQRGFLDYNDLIHLGTALLKDSSASDWILYKLDGGIDHILVDEAQDTSPAQWDIVSALSSEFFSGNSGNETPRSLFVVGDEKQSIYSFQGADPKKFHEMQTDFSGRAAQAMQSWHNVELDRSFRSTEPILQVVDAIFSSTDLKQAISPSLPVQHTAHRKGHAGIVEVWSPFAAEKEETIEPWPLPNQHVTATTSSTKLADKIADTIATWIQSKRLLASKNRPVTAGDIMILVRRRNDFVADMIRALKQRHIPVSGTDRMKLLEHIAILDLIALGKFLLLPQDDLNLATVLKTPLIGLSEEELFTLAYNRKGSLWESLQYRQKENPAFQRAYDYLASLLKHTDFDTPFALFNDVLEVQQGRKAFIQRLGHEVNDPLDEFISLSLTYQQIFTPSLQGFLHWLETSQVEIKRDMEQGSDQVRIMTIHGSKGLQAPIVFLPDTTQVPTPKDRLLWVDNLVFWAGGKKNESSVYAAFRDTNKAFEEQEYYRLLYVALTRPEDELYICGYYESRKPSEKCWYSVICSGLQPIAEKIDSQEPGQPILRLVSEQEAPTSANTYTFPNTHNIPLPVYFLTVAPQEVSPRKLAPSQTADHISEAISPLSEHHHIATLRGTLVHRLLEFLPNLPPEHRLARAKTFLEAYRNEFSANAFETLLTDVVHVLENQTFAFLFSGHSQAEVAVTGTINGQAITGQIDRLVVEGDNVWIIDYKTIATPPTSEANIPPAYREQLALYKALIAPLYPEKTIRCALLWIANLKLMEIT